MRRCAERFRWAATHRLVVDWLKMMSARQRSGVRLWVALRAVDHPILPRGAVDRAPPPIGTILLAGGAPLRLAGSDGRRVARRAAARRAAIAVATLSRGGRSVRQWGMGDWNGDPAAALSKLRIEGAT